MSIHFKCRRMVSSVTRSTLLGLVATGVTLSVPSGCSKASQEAPSSAMDIRSPELPSHQVSEAIEEPAAFEHDSPAKAAESSNQLAFKVYRELAKSGENLSYSPVSVATVLSMGLAGARGSTARELETLLELEPGHTVHGGFKQLVKSTMIDGLPQNRFLMANAFMYQHDLQVSDGFMSILRTNYEAEMFTADFVRNPPDAINRMNAWVEQRTDGRIQGLLGSNDVDANTCLILANTLLFDGVWESPFNPDQTANAPFQLERGGSVSTPMMYQKGHFELGTKQEEPQVIRLPYVGGQMEMVIVMPPQGGSLETLEDDFSAATLLSWLVGCSPEEIDLYLPRFKGRTSIYMNNALANLGASCLYDPSCANFSGISNERIWVSQIKHACYVEVDEKGTRAAAATAMINTRSSSVPSEFRVDRPFLYFIRETVHGTILLMGRVTNPLE